jgi:hypothetical protein
MRASVFLAVVLCAPAQALAQAPGPAAGSVYVGVSAGLAQFRPPVQSAGCAPPGNRGIFCGRASGIVPAIAGEAGVFLVRYVAVAVEGSLSRGKEGFAAYDQQSHTDYNVTTATFNHSAERGLSGLIVGRVPLGTRGAAIEPFIGGTLVHATDSLTDQVRVAGAAGFPRVTSYPIDAKAQYSSKGFIIGVRATTRPGRGVSVVSSLRARWLNWPQVLTNTYHAFKSSGSTQLVPVSVGRWSFVASVGVRWTQK